ncbi:transposase, partial [Treponema sp.]
MNLVTGDGARWLKTCVEKYCPNAERCIDPFHVIE